MNKTIRCILFAHHLNMEYTSLDSEATLNMSIKDSYNCNSHFRNRSRRDEGVKATIYLMCVLCVLSEAGLHMSACLPNIAC